MSEFIDKEGVQVEVFTAEEIAAKEQEAIEQYKQDNPDKSTELSELEAKLAEAEEKLSKVDDKSQNFASLRKAKDEAEKKLADTMSSIDEKISNVKKEVLEGVMKDHYNDTLKAFAGEDEELKKKIELNYKRLGDAPATKAEIENKLRDAYVLSTKTEEASALNSTVLSSGGVSRLNIPSQGQKLSAEEKAVGAKLGISEADFKKYGN